MPEVAPVAPVDVQPATPEIPSLATEPLIYGGASPVVGDINVAPVENHQIYGGADPLQNTQTIPGLQAPAVAPVSPVEPVMQTPAMPEVVPAPVEAQPVVQIQQ